MISKGFSINHNKMSREKIRMHNFNVCMKTFWSKKDMFHGFTEEINLLQKDPSVF